MNKRYSILILFLLIFSITLNAQSVNKNTLLSEALSDTLNMQTVVVTSTRSLKSIKNIPIQTQVITQKEIRSSGMSSLTNVLSSQLPGLEFHQTGSGVSMTFQGLDARQVLILVDGERMSGEINGNVDFSRIPIETISRIEVVKGSSSVIYGSNAMGATINIITKVPTFGLDGSAYYSYGGLNQSNPKEKEQGIKSDIQNMTAAAYLGYASEKFTSSTDVAYQGIDPYRMVSKSPERRHYTEIGGKAVDRVMYVDVDSNGVSVSGWQVMTINQKFKYNFSDNVSASARGGYFWKNRYDLGDYSSSSTDEQEHVPFENYQGYDFTGQVDYKINKLNNLNFSFHTTTTNRDENNMGEIIPKQRQNVSTARILYQTEQLKNNSISAGIEFNRETLNLDISPTGFENRYSSNYLSIYLQDNAKLSERIELLAGIRLDNYGFTSAKEAVDNLFAPDNNTSEKMGVSLTPQLSLKYAFDKISLRFNYAMGFRSPSLKERYMEYYQPYMGMIIKGNENLVPEVNNYFSISSDYLSDNKKLYIAASVYANLFNNKIDAYHDIETDQLIYQNTVKTQLYGADIIVKLMIMKGWWVNASYAYSYRNESGPVNSAQYVFASPHTASLQSSYNFIAGRWLMGPNVSLNYYSSKTFEDMMPTIIHNSGSLVPEVIEGIYNGRLEGYLMCNMSYSAKFNHKLTLTLGVNNLFDYTPTTASFNSAMTSGITGYISARFLF